MPIAQVQLSYDCVLHNLASTLKHAYEGPVQATNITHMPMKVSWDDLSSNLPSVVPAKHWHESHRDLVSCKGTHKS